MNNWHSITSNKFILRIIEKGYKIQITRSDIQLPPVISKPSKLKRNILLNEIKSNLESGSISYSTSSTYHIVSRVFTVPKQSGGHRLVIDLSSLNKFVSKSPFKMEDKETLKSLIEPFDFMASIDLQNAFHSISLHPDSKKFVAIEFEGSLFEFNVIPFGLTSAPSIFTKLLRPVISHLRSSGIKISSYLDDIFICGKSLSKVKSDVDVTIKLLLSLGFSINWNKSVLTPSQTLFHLGFIWDSTSSTISLPEAKLVKIKILINICMNKPQKIRLFSSLLGSLVSTHACFKFAPLYYRNFQIWFIKSLKCSFSWNDIVYPDVNSISDLNWWKSCSLNMITPVCFITPNVDLVLYSDASLSGWGAYLSSGEITSGVWTPPESKRHINFLELKGIHLAIKNFLPKLKSMNISIRCDNSTSIYYLNKIGGTHSQALCLLALEIVGLLKENYINFEASHIYGVDNYVADFFSRHTHLHEYYLTQSAFNSVSSLLDFTLTIDIFASKVNKKLENYCSMFSDHECFKIDAFSFTWPSNIYLFPPIPLIPKCMVKILRDNVDKCLLITPSWKSLSVLPLILKYLFELPIFIESHELLGHLPTRGPFNLMAWPISASSVRNEEFQKICQMQSSIASDQIVSNLIQDTGNNLQIGLTKLNLPPRSLKI